MEKLLFRVTHLWDIKNLGDYTFADGFSGEGEHMIRSLVLSCPFCGTTTNASHTLTLIEEPLTIESPLTCPTCNTKFSIKEGKAEKEKS